MVKAVFIDYMGTTVDEHSPEMAKIIRRICKNSSIHDPRQVQRFILDIRFNECCRKPKNLIKQFQSYC